jgi:hypothetical protein
MIVLLSFLADTHGRKIFGILAGIERKSTHITDSADIELTPLRDIVAERIPCHGGNRLPQAAPAR